MAEEDRNSSAANQDPQLMTVDPRDLSLVERFGSYVLFAGGVVAWTFALLNVDQDAPASAWIAAGLVLLLGAAFFHRVLKIGKDGLELARLRQVISNADQIAPTEDDTPDEATKRLLSYLRMNLYESTGTQTEELIAGKREQQATTRWRHTEWDRVESNLVNSVEAWLTSKGFEVAREFHERGSWRFDMRAARGELVIDVEIRSAIEALGRSDAAVLVARRSHSGNHRAVVVNRDARISKEALDLLETNEVALWVANPDEVANVKIIAGGSLPDLS